MAKRGATELGGSSKSFSNRKLGGVKSGTRDVRAQASLVAPATLNVCVTTCPDLMLGRRSVDITRAISAARDQPHFGSCGSGASVGRGQSDGSGRFLKYLTWAKDHFH